MLAYFGTDVDRGESAVRVDVDGVESVGAERSDEKWSLNLLKIDLPGDVVEEVGVNEFFTGVPDVAVLLVDDGVLVRVVVIHSKARWGGEEVGEGEEVGGKRGEEGGVASGARTNQKRIPKRPKDPFDNYKSFDYCP